MDAAWTDIKFVGMSLPGMIEVIAESILLCSGTWWVCEEDQAVFQDYYEFLNNEIFADPDIGEVIHQSVNDKHHSWIQISEKYYSRQISFNEVLRRETRAAQYAKATCYACGAKGHMSRACSAPEELKAAYQAWYQQQRATASKTAGRNSRKRPTANPKKQSGPSKGNAKWQRL